MPGLLDLLKEEFAMPVEELYPFRKVSIVPDATMKTSFANWRAPGVAVGLALRSFDNQ